MTAQPRAHLRADARRNRAQIITTATRAFVDNGPDVPLEEIARLAGVGIGTLYRNFPDREALILAVVQTSMGVMLTKAREARAEHEHAWDALARTLSTSRELSLTLRVQRLFSPATVAALSADPTIRQIRNELIKVIDDLVQAAQREGSMRPDVDTGDVTHLFSLLMLPSTHRTPSEIAEMSYDRAREIIFDGLRARPGTPLPGRPLSATDIYPD
ncbi:MULTISPECIES: TetR/AcrR family transcriptional regulator [Protofrankia]|uniref:TetR family transcriptional regulator n=1 Tax=Protofrankia coriariae TaxID=1562887 RepID=A0ABR5F232_9ACTN|nr:MULTISPECIES: TetR/AcrR family transcriptional regulator [Protofrankia]KLL10786.1 TetR family transcriptional regulator [Protofrankia coriariae]ONH34061.1 TetR family transcriptional regulator [Protofrankia sp. BMG5.30]